jgi:hypothetical protein
MALLLATPGWLDVDIRPGLGQSTLWLTRDARAGDCLGRGPGSRSVMRELFERGF